MTANELRIGNIINDDRKAKDWRFASHRIIADMASNPNTELYHAIPLTEEWLLKFGFSKAEKPQITSFFKVYDSLGAIYSFQIFMDYDKPVVMYRLPDRVVFIQYVHQLQNLFFAITGEELTIKEPQPTSK